MRMLTSRCIAQSGLSTRVGLALLQDVLKPEAVEEGNAEEHEQQKGDKEESGDFGDDESGEDGYESEGSVAGGDSVNIDDDYDEDEPPGMVPYRPASTMPLHPTRL